MILSYQHEGAPPTAISIESGCHNYSRSHVGAVPRRDQKQALSKDETDAAIPIGVQIVLAKLAEIQPNFKDALLFFPSMLCALARVFVPLNF